MAFKPMLAAEADLSKLRFPLVASPKLDGIRCSVLDGKALTRSLKDLPNRHARGLLSDPMLDGLDGELIVGDPTAHDAYRTSASGLMSRDGTPEFTYYVFDLHDEPAPWQERFERLQRRYMPEFVKVLPHMTVSSLDELLAYEVAMLAQGYEGLILRDPSGAYKFGRSTVREGLLLKLKRFSDAEAIVIDTIEELHNANEARTNALGRTERSSHRENKTGTGRMGALVVRDVETDVVFNIGTGFNAEDREQSNWVGKMVKYKSFKIGVKDKPRHPVFLGVRDARDMS